MGCCGNDGKEKEKVVVGPPTKDRGCTDIICCVVFALYMIGMVIVAIIAIKQGDPKKLLYPTDSNGKICGVDDAADKPFLHFFDLTKCVTKGAKDPFSYIKKGFGCPTPQVCVKKCPTVNQLGELTNVKDMICVDGTELKKGMSQSDKKKLIGTGKCAPYYLESKTVFYRCVPSAASAVINKIGIKDKGDKTLNSTDIKDGSTAQEIMLSMNKLIMKVGDELLLTWKWLLLGFVLSMVISVVYIVLARWITFPLVIISALGTLILLGYSVYHSFAKYKYLVDTGTSKDLVWRISMGTDDFARSKTCWLVLGIVLAVLLLTLLLICIFLYSNVKLACVLIAEASRAICAMLSTLVFPLIPWILQAAWAAWFIAVMLYLMSNSTQQYQVSKNDTMYNLTFGSICNHKTFNQTYAKSIASCLYVKNVPSTYLFNMQVYHVFGWLWMANFIIAFTEFSLAGAFASYFWTMDKKDTPAFPIIYSMGNALVYHTGSLALGAAIIAVVQLIRITLEFIHRKLKENTDNAVANFIMTCLKCCFWCLEKCLRFINKNAYVMIAITGKSFCVSAKNAVLILIKKLGDTIAINGITGFVLLLGKVLITGGVGVGSFFWFRKYNANLPDKLEYSFVPIIICVVMAYLVTRLFFSVYDMGIDTMFLCYCVDQDVNNGSAEKPYYASKELLKIMGQYNEKAEKKPEEIPLPTAEA